VFSGIDYIIWKKAPMCIIMKILKLLGPATSKINMLHVHGSVADPDPHGSAFWEAGSGFRSRSRVKSWIRIRIRIKIKIQEH
jgi:hypothetical protein